MQSAIGFQYQTKTNIRADCLLQFINVRCHYIYIHNLKSKINLIQLGITFWNNFHFQNQTIIKDIYLLPLRQFYWLSQTEIKFRQANK